MTKNDIKKFVEEHDKEIEIVKRGLKLAWTGVEIWALITVFKDMKSFDKYWKKASADSKVYLPAVGEDLQLIMRDLKGVIDAGGTKIDVTGMLLFGNPVEN